MAGPLVETKLFVPKLRSSLVGRPRLTGRLGRGEEARLTVVSAPAGFGKTTMLAEWSAAADPDRSVAWLSLDDGDRVADSFWTYLITALRTVRPDAGAEALELLSSGQAPIDAVLTTLVNDLRAPPDELAVDLDLVLDDYHLVDGPGICAGMEFLLAHLPAHVHLVIGTRVDPLLPLARLRARGELVEIRAADLRFTADEAAAYLNDTTGLGLSAAELDALTGRTEGWIAALQLAALSMQGRTDVGGFIAGFAGDDRYIIDYLVEEVLRHQPEPVRTFLLRTCILDRLSGPLCDAVTGGADGRTMLDTLERGNLFVVPLDDNRRWFRYHHLFADVLLTHLGDERGDEVAGLHRRASAWYAQHDEPRPAVRHSLAAGDGDRAAELVELAIPELRRNRQEATIRSWIDVIPPALVRNRPVLGIGFIGGLMASGDWVGIEARLADAERSMKLALDDPDGRLGRGAGIVVADPGELPRLPGAIEMYRAALALIGGDPPATIRHAQRAVELVADDDHLVRSAAHGLLGLAQWTSGDLDAAYRSYAACADGLRRIGHLSDVLGCSIALADIRVTQGRLDDARRVLEQAAELATRPDGWVLRGTADMHVGLSEIACERGDVGAAQQHLHRSLELGEQLGLPQNRYRAQVAQARVHEATGELDAARECLDEAERRYCGDFFPDVRPVAALRARILSAQGDWAPANAWARERGLSVDDELAYLREYEHVSLARLLVARYAAERQENLLPAVEGFLARLLSAAGAGGRTGSVIDILVLQAMARQAAADRAGALVPLERALALAEPAGHARIFLNHGDAMTHLLQATAKHGRAAAYARHLLSSGVDAGPSGTDRPRLVDPLSERELDVLRLLTTDLDGPTIARQLRVSLNTVRTHTKSIYAKLGVNSRRAAVRRAGELALVPSSNR